MSIAANIAEIQAELGPDVTLVAVSKYSSDRAVTEAYDAGHRHFGENKARDLEERAAAMPEDIKWHFIGHLQRNKVKYIAPAVHCIHGVDSLRLLEEIDKRAGKVPRTVKCLLQLHIAEEETKFGLSEEEAEEILRSTEMEEFSHVRVIGLMGMATNTDNAEQIRREFKRLKKFYDKLQALTATAELPEDDDRAPTFPPNVEMRVLSMGMSADYKIAVEEGSTMVRIGSAVFKEE